MNLSYHRDPFAGPNLEQKQEGIRAIRKTCIGMINAGQLSSTDVGLPDYSLTGRNFNNIRSVTVSLRVKASLPDPNYTDQTFGDSYRRIYLSGEVFPRNLGF